LGSSGTEKLCSAGIVGVVGRGVAVAEGAEFAAGDGFGRSGLYRALA
jgi:hypothetical protein